MLSGMRYTVLLIVFLTLACSKKDAPSEAATETETPAEASDNASPAPKAEPEKAALPLTGPPTVTLITAGKPPLQPLRWQFREGTKEVLETSINQVFEMKGGGWDHRSVPTPIAQTIDFTTKRVSADGNAEVDLFIREVTELESPEADSPAIIGGKSATGTYKVDSTAVIQDLVLVPSAESKYKQLGVLESLLRLTLFPVPKEPIGAGAKWTVERDISQFGHQAIERMMIEALEVTDSGAVLRVEIKVHGGKPGGPKQTVTLDTDTEVLAKLSSAKLVPLSVELENHTVETVKTAGVDGPMGQLTARTDRTVTMQSD